MRRLIPIALILALLLAACGAPESGIEGVTAENYPRINGSEDAMPLIQLVFERVHTQYSGGDYPTEALGAEESYEALLAGELVVRAERPVCVPAEDARGERPGDTAGVPLGLGAVAGQGCAVGGPAAYLYGDILIRSV